MAKDTKLPEGGEDGTPEATAAPANTTVDVAAIEDPGPEVQEVAVEPEVPFRPQVANEPAFIVVNGPGESLPPGVRVQHWS